MAQGDLERERDTISSLKATISTQSTAQVSMTGQVNALQAQLSAMQTALDQSSNNGTSLLVELEREKRRVAELEEETLKAETLRRKLHNMVQELKVDYCTLIGYRIGDTTFTRYRVIFACTAVYGHCWLRTCPSLLSTGPPPQIPTVQLHTTRSGCSRQHALTFRSLTSYFINRSRFEHLARVRPVKNVRMNGCSLSIG